MDPTMPYHNPGFSSGERVVFYCASGGRSALSADTAQSMGLESVSHVGDGFKAWKGSERSGRESLRGSILGEWRNVHGDLGLEAGLHHDGCKRGSILFSKQTSVYAVIQALSAS